MALRFLMPVGCKIGQGVSLGFKGAGGPVWGTCLHASSRGKRRMRPRKPYRRLGRDAHTMRSMCALQAAVAMDTRS